MGATSGDTVKIKFTGHLEDGTEFGNEDEDNELLEFTIGEHQVIVGVEEAVIGMEEGESKTVSVPADKAYGIHHDELTMKVKRERLPDDVEPKVGDRYKLKESGDKTTLVTVTDVDQNAVQLDGNHPLAGHDITFDITLVEID